MIARLALPLLAAGLLLAQPSPVEAVNSLPPEPDTSAPADTARPAAIPGKSPGRAVLLSLLIPGGGQVYTGHWWKTCIIAPAEVTLACLAVLDHRSAMAALEGGDDESYVVLRDRRNAFLYFTGAVLAYSMADAWVSARMYAFDRQMQFAVTPSRVAIRMGI